MGTIIKSLRFARDNNLNQSAVINFQAADDTADTATAAANCEKKVLMKKIAQIRFSTYRSSIKNGPQMNLKICPKTLHVCLPLLLIKLVDSSFF